jgi:maltooligosyltrehalose trehalohydrolase
MDRPEMADRMANPSDESTFLASRLDRAHRPPDDANPVDTLFRDLLRLRREDPVFRTRRADRIHAAILSPQAFVLRYLGDQHDDRLIVVNLGRDIYPAPATEPLLAPPAGSAWSVLWSSEAPEYDGQGIPPLDTRIPWRITAHATLVLAPVPEESLPPIGDEKTQGPIPADILQDIHPGVRARFQHRED